MARVFDLDPFPNAILVVDDEKSIRHLLSTFLGKSGWEIHTAATGRQALASLERERLACLVCDKNLEGQMDGIEVMRIMRQAQPYCACVMITAYASKESAIEAMALGAADYIEKPFTDLFLVGERIERAINTFRGAYEHDGLVRQIRLLLQLNEGSEEATGEIDLFNQILDWHTGLVVDDLRRDLEAVTKTLEHGAGAAAVAVAHTNELLRRVREIVIDDADAAVKVRHLLIRVVDSLETNVALLEKAGS